MNRGARIVAVVTALAFPAAAAAHHGWAWTEEQETRLTGTIEAISFGNLLDGDKSTMVRAKASERNYDLLNYIGTRPRTSYLARVKNPNPKMPDAKFVGKATIDMV